MKGTRLLRTPAGIMIGSAYQLPAYERRTPDAYQALRPEPTVDGLLLQQALLKPRRKPLQLTRRMRVLARRRVRQLMSADSMANLVCMGGFVSLLAGIAFIGPEVM